jgi:hypothetical protein
VPLELRQAAVRRRDQPAVRLVVSAHASCSERNVAPAFADRVQPRQLPPVRPGAADLFLKHALAAGRLELRWQRAETALIARLQAKGFIG